MLLQAKCQALPEREEMKLLLLLLLLLSLELFEERINCVDLEFRFKGRYLFAFAVTTTSLFEVDDRKLSTATNSEEEVVAV